MIRHLFRALMSAIFIYGGIDSLRRPEEKVEMTEGVVEELSEEIGDQLPSLPIDERTLVLANGGVQVAGGAMLLLNIAPRTASAALAGTLVPTTYAAHRFWEEPPETRQAQLLQFLKNLAILGGLALSTLDHEGKPGPVWRVGHAAHDAAAHAEWKRREAELLAQLARQRAATRAAAARTAAAEVKGRAEAGAAELRGKAETAAADLKGRTVRPAKRMAADTKIAGRTLRSVGGTVAGGASWLVRSASRLVSMVLRTVGRAVSGLWSSIRSG